MRPAARRDGRLPVLYIAPWVDYGGSDTGTIDWFRQLDRQRFRASLITTQPSPNRRLADIVPFADEVWPLTELMPGDRCPGFILDFIHTRGIRVVHIMNSRLGFQMLPDLRRLPDPPSTVVQLHVEEPDKVGYVRYVSTRYGNLVDAFSVSSRHLARGVAGYDVPEAKCRVIHTGVDAEALFNPDLVVPLDLGPRRDCEILFPARLTEQKHPERMLEVAAALRATGRSFRIHCVGDGNLEQRVRQRIATAGLGDTVILHGASREMPRWYRSVDLVLLTSAWEGVPYSVYEAMAMAVPLVAPALPGTVELTDGHGGSLVAEGAAAEEYVAALLPLIDDPAARRRIGAQARQTCRERFSLRSMAAEHEQLYFELAGLPGVAEPPRPRAAEAPIRLRARVPGASPLVSVIVPCFNHGRYLEGCLESVAAQTYPAIEVIVVDDASTDAQTAAVLEEVSSRPGVTVLRLPRNVGPSSARNAALRIARGRYILPVDADNLLTTDAVASLVRQLQGAGEQIGFVYPNQSFFGNRDDQTSAPDYNLHTLLQLNYCDTCSLIDRDVFDAGVQYADDIHFGHEDWDFALQLARRGVHGVPARSQNLLTRKSGFSRSDLVDHDWSRFAERMRARHADLYAREESVKARWSPALSLIALAPAEGAEARERLIAAVAAQTCGDAEVVVRDVADWPELVGPAVRRIHPELACDEADAVATALEVARGRYLMVTRGSGLELLEDRAAVEKLLHLFETQGCRAIVAVDTGDPHLVPLVTPSQPAAASLEPVAIGWSVLDMEAVPPVLVADSGDALGALLAGLLAQGPVHRVQVASPAAGATRQAEPRPTSLGYASSAGTPSQQRERGLRLQRPALLPGLPADAAPSWLGEPWRPPHTRGLYRHRRLDGPERVCRLEREPPPGFALDRDLGSINSLPLAGTVPLVMVGDREYAAREPGAGDILLGHLERHGLPMLDPVGLARHRRSGQLVVVSGDDDPLLEAVDVVAELGYVEPCPIRPRSDPDGEADGVLAALARREADVDRLDDALDAARQAISALEHAVGVERARGDQLQARLDRIVASLPARLYRRVMWIPGVRAAVHWNRSRGGPRGGLG